MVKKILHVLAVEGALQPNFEAFDGGVRRFVGWKFDPTIGDVSPKGVPQGGFVWLSEGELVPNRAEYRQAVKDGMLKPADEETAKVCGVKFSKV